MKYCNVTPVLTTVQLIIGMHIRNPSPKAGAKGKGLAELLDRLLSATSIRF